MDGDDLAGALYARMRWNTPLSPQHADLLMERLDLRPGLRIADVRCGWGEFLLRVVSRAMGPDAAGGAGQVSGFGVDADAAALGRARGLASQRGLDRQVEFAEGDAAAWRGTADRVLCVGASHECVKLTGTVPGQLGQDICPRYDGIVPRQLSFT